MVRYHNGDGALSLAFYYKGYNFWNFITYRYRYLFLKSCILSLSRKRSFCEIFSDVEDSRTNRLTCLTRKLLHSGHIISDDATRCNAKSSFWFGNIGEPPVHSELLLLLLLLPMNILNLSLLSIHLMTH